MEFVLIDGNSLINRAFYATPPMSNSKGEPTNAVYAFCNMLIKIKTRYGDEIYINLNYVVIVSKYNNGDETFYNITQLQGSYTSNIEVTPEEWERIRNNYIDAISLATEEDLSDKNKVDLIKAVLKTNGSSEEKTKILNELI